jgi:hypothetical protein
VRIQTKLRTTVRTGSPIRTETTLRTVTNKNDDGENNAQRDTIR